MRGFRNILLTGSAFAGAAIGLPATALAQAQTTAASNSAEASTSSTQTVVVTGTRLRRETLDAPNPTVQVGAKELEDRQIANVGDAIEDVPLVGFGSNARGTQSQNGDSFILPDVLDLGTQRTLTLLNGRRLQPSLPATNFVPGNNTGSQVDLTTINPALIARVDVVAGTGGAIYGADAVGGVINLITRNDYEGRQVTLSVGATQLGDGEQGRLTALWGKNFFDGRGNITASIDYNVQAPIFASSDNAVRYQGSNLTNPFEGSVRDTGTFSAAAAADALRGGTALNPAFLPSTADGISSQFFGPLNLVSRLQSPDGVLLTRWQTSPGFTGTSQLIPSVPVNPAAAGRAADPQGFAFFAPTALPTGVSATAVINTIAPGTNITGLTTAQVNALALQLLQRNRPTPIEWLRRNPNVNPMLLVGTFGTTTNLTSTAPGAQVLAGGYFPTIANTDPATNVLFPRIAVPLQFDSDGNLRPFNLGSLTADNPGLWGSGFGGDGYDSTESGHLQIQAGVTRASFGGIGTVEVTDFLRVRTEFLYTNIEYKQIVAALSNTVTGSAAAGSFAIPLYIDQNPFITSSAINQINGLVTQGFTVPTNAGQRVLFVGRTLTDILGGGLESRSNVETARFMTALEGEFSFLGRDLYYDITGIYGESQTIARQKEISDIGFALAIDPVRNANGQIVCRQQTLATPENITIRNPGITTGLTTVSLVPTAEQVAACRPLNLLGNRQLSASDLAGVLIEQRTDSLNQLTVGSFSLGGELFELPAGWIQIGIQAEAREEQAAYRPNQTLRLGAGRNATQGANEGSRSFLEYGYELNIPIFGDDFNFFGARSLEFAYAWRMVERTQRSPFSNTTGAETKDDTFNYSFRWEPVEGLTLRGARSRTVRSPSLIELFDPGLRAFGGLSAQSHPCSTVNIGSGPAPATRRANCIAAVRAYGIAANNADAETFLATFQPATAPNRPATAAGNPFLGNEEANAFTLGVTFEPTFIPRLVLAIDYFNIDLAGELGLTGTPTTTNACFDSASFPASIVGAANPACDAFLFAQPSPSGNFVVPTVNPLTGRETILTRAYGGQVTSPNAPFEISAIDFLNLNLGQRELRSWNFEARYNFSLGEVPFVGGFMDKWGDLFLRGTVYKLDRFDVFNPSLNQDKGEHTRPEYKTRLDVRHRVGRFEQTLQWYWNSETLTNVMITTPIVEQSPAFVSPEFHYFNYFANYRLSENLSVRFVVNNLFDTIEPRGIYGVGNDYDGGVGREFLFSVTANF
jgi:outer membrane receptor protein involved in Fe transport